MQPDDQVELPLFGGTDRSDDKLDRTALFQRYIDNRRLTNRITAMILLILFLFSLSCIAGATRTEGAVRALFLLGCVMIGVSTVCLLVVAWNHFSYNAAKDRLNNWASRGNDVLEWSSQSYTKEEWQQWQNEEFGPNGRGYECCPFLYICWITTWCVVFGIIGAFSLYAGSPVGELSWVSFILIIAFSVATFITGLAIMITILSKCFRKDPVCGQDFCGNNEGFLWIDDFKTWEAGATNATTLEKIRFNTYDGQMIPCLEYGIGSADGDNVRVTRIPVPSKFIPNASSFAERLRENHNLNQPWDKPPDEGPIRRLYD